MKCKDAYQFLLEELDEHLDEPSRRQIRVHLEHCEDCVEMLHSLKATVAAYQSVPEVRVPKALTARVLSTLKSSVKSKHRKHSAPRR
jgi:anti-sigma factor RsiW